MHLANPSYVYTVMWSSQNHLWTYSCTLRAADLTQLRWPSLASTSMFVQHSALLSTLPY